MNRINQEFTRRVSRIPFHGIGLSVDVYSPDVFELTGQLDAQGLDYTYLEMFKADQIALEEVRFRRPSTSFEYHAEGLWVTQPDWMVSYPYEDELIKAMMHLRSLDCSWLNHECATKQMGGHSFGTYLPPLFTESSAQITACNVEFAQHYLDTQFKGHTKHSPLFLLETPPLTYFMLGNISYCEFFRILADHCSCGFVLDIGHIWTVYRYTGVSENLSVGQFFKEFLNSFPLDRVVEIHVAGLDFHPAVPREEKGGARMPNWVDAHQAPIPLVVFDMLEEVLFHEELPNIKGLALEVDTKSIDLIIKEFSELRKRFGRWEQSQTIERIATVGQQEDSSFSMRLPTYDSRKRKDLEHRYQQYVKMVTGQEAENSFVPDNDSLLDRKTLEWYSANYLPYEIFQWGGNLNDMFPKTILSLECTGKGIENFLAFWYSHPQSVCEPYDFFLLKVHYFVEYIRAEYPQCLSLAVNEATDLRNGYALACRGSLTNVS